MTTGPLGQGLAAAVGMAIAEAHLAARFNRPGHPVVDHRTYVFASDGDLMEGLSAEACALAGHLGLGKLTVLYDDNRISLSGSTSLCFTEDIDQRFAASGWQVIAVADGNDTAAVDRAPRGGEGRDGAAVAHPPPDDDRLRGAREAEYQRGPRLAPRGGGAQGGQGEPRLAGRSPLLRSGGGARLLPRGKGRRRKRETGSWEGGFPALRRRVSRGGRRIRTGHEGRAPGRLGEGASRLRPGDEGRGDAQDLGGRPPGPRDGDSGADGGLGRSEPLHLLLAQGAWAISRSRASRPPAGKGRAAGSGATAAGTSTSASGSTRWRRSPAGWRSTGGSSPSPGPSSPSPTTCGRRSAWPP